MKQFTTLLAILSLALGGCATSGGRDSGPGPTRPYMGKLHVIPVQFHATAALGN